MQYYYYIIKNLQNDKKYVGITTNPTKRKQEHFNNLKQNKHCNQHLQSAYNLYGESCFEFQIIEERDFSEKQDAYDYEWYLIQQMGDYNILQGALINPMYTEEIKLKMTKTKQSQVDDIVQIAAVDENENIYQVVTVWNSMKEASKVGSYDFRNICKSIKDGVKGDGYYWVKVSEFDSWIPKSKFNCYVAEIDDNNNVLSVEKSPSVYEKREHWATSSIINAIKRNGKTHGRRFKKLSIEEFLLYKPLIIKPVSTRAEA